MKKVRYFIIVEGQVQNVGFRIFTQIKAIPLNITGYAKNLDNGMVEICAQGYKSNINTLIKEIKKGNRFINVENISIKEIPLVENEKKFISL